MSDERTHFSDNYFDLASGTRLGQQLGECIGLCANFLGLTFRSCSRFCTFHRMPGSCSRCSNLQMIEHLKQTVTQFEAQIEAALNPFRAVVERLVTIPGVSTTAAHVIIAEIGVDMSRFPTVGHLRLGRTVSATQRECG